VVVTAVEILVGKRVVVLWVVIHARGRAKADEALSGFQDALLTVPIRQ
jgi:hypothetical protein